MVIITELVETDFNKSKFPTLFSDERTNRVFALISYGDYAFKLAWQSDLIRPLVTEVAKEICTVGIDQNFAIVNFNTGSIVLKIVLDYLFYDVKVYDGYIYVVTELEVIKISQGAFEVIGRYDILDIFEEIQFKNNEVQIRCSGGMSVIL